MHDNSLFSDIGVSVRISSCSERTCDILPSSLLPVLFSFALSSTTSYFSLIHRFVFHPSLFNGNFDDDLSEMLNNERSFPPFIEISINLEDLERNASPRKEGLKRIENTCIVISPSSSNLYRD